MRRNIQTKFARLERRFSTFNKWIDKRIKVAVWTNKDPVMPAYKDKNGKWYVKFQYREHGKPKTKLKRGFTKKREALEYERNFLTNYYPSVDMTFDTLMLRFIEAKERELRHNTLRGYQALHGSSYIDSIRNKKLSEITPTDMLTVRNGINREPSTVNLYMQKLSTVFKFAVTMYGLPKNPCAGIKSLKQGSKEMKFLTIEELERAKAIPMAEDTKMLLELLFWTGMRISEALALTVGDIHDTYISVFKHKAGSRSGTVVYRGLKNNQGRKVAIFASLREELSEYISKMYGHTPDIELFPLDYSTYQRRFTILYRKAGLEGATIHSLRHSHVALLIHLGYSPKMIADRIGDTVNTMMNTYAHIYETDVSSMMEKLNDVSNMYHNKP